jgi:hypothetical protein
MVDTFTARTRRYMQAAAEAARGWYAPDGAWLLPSKPAETRERFWLACALYGVGDDAFADAVVRRGETAWYRDHPFNIFDTNIAVALLANYRAQMAADVRALLETLARGGFSFKPGNRQPDYQFHGFNDNMPAKATMGLILGGELLDEPAAVEYGLWNLRQLRAMLVRSGINSEFNSPTYSPLTIHAMGEIAEHARTPEARELARAIEERLWIDVAARYHPEIGVIAGPYARAYTLDTVAHASVMAALLWFVLGDGVNPSPMSFFTEPDDLVLHHRGDLPFNIVQQCWLAAGAYHVPSEAQALFREKRYPFRAVATAEQGDAGPDFPARPCRLESVLYPDFTVGTASTPLCGGEQTMSYFVTYKRRDPVGSFRDVGTVFNKLVLDDDVPGRLLAAEAMPDAGAELHPDKPAQATYANTGEEDHLHSHESTLTLQAGATALVLTHPHLALGDGGREIRRMSELVICPAHFGGAEEILVDGQPREAWDGPVPPGAWIACRRGRLYLAIRPLAYSRAFGTAAVTLERHNRYETIRFALYDGAPRAFSRTELRHIFSGFVAEHAGVGEFPSLAAFAASLAGAQFTDYFWNTRRVRYRRPGLEMEVSWSPGTHQPRVAAINGHPVPWPAVAIDGLEASALPLLNAPFASVPSFFPWDELAVEWGDWPSAIGDREGDGAPVGDR